jgi:dolichyl-phosphate-mannose-protein mannosyltransferase
MTSAAPTAAPAWSRADTVVIALLVGAAAVFRFWRLGFPLLPVFDEGNFVGQAGAYLHRIQFVDPHPPLTKELIALSMRLFGPAHPWAWRLPNAIVGTALVAITYLLARRMFNSRPAATLAASFIAFDGIFIVDSRIGVLEIVYVTLAALAYLLLFRFLQTRGQARGRRTMLWLGIVLGLSLGAKLLLPGVAFLLVLAFLIYALAADGAPAADRGSPGGVPAGPRIRLIAGAVLLVGSTAALGYLAVFMPNYLILRWGGVRALLHYFGDSLWWEQGATNATDWRSSRWWSWPLMLHPFVYWPGGDGAGTIWFGGNPILWWGALGAIGIAGARLVSRPSLTTAFLVSGYLGYLLIEVPIRRPMYIYHYVPSLYLSYLALAMVVGDCWRGAARRWEQALLLAALAPAVALAIGGAAGVLAAVALAAACGAMLWWVRDCGRVTCAAFLTAALAVSVYFLPIWVGLPSAPPFKFLEPGAITFRW